MIVFITTSTKLNMYSDTVFDGNDRHVAIVPFGHRVKIRRGIRSFFYKILEFGGEKSISDLFREHCICRDDVKIVSMSEEMLLEVALLREEFGLFGMSYQDTLVFRDKAKMKRFLKVHHIPMPNFVDYLPIMSFDDYKEVLGCPFVIKPTQAFGAENFFKIESEQQYLEAQYLLKDTTMSCVAETFVQGIVLHCESIIKDGQIIFSKVGKYSSPPSSFKDYKAIFNTFLEDDDMTIVKAKKFNELVLRAMPISEGITHHEFFLTPEDDFLFLEIAARTPGGMLVPQYVKKFGINLLDISFFQQTKQEYNLSIYESEDYVSTGLFPVGVGLVEKLNVPKLHSKFEMNHHIKKGDILSGTTQIRNIAADILLYNKDKKALERDIQYLSSFQVCDVKK